MLNPHLTYLLCMGTAVVVAMAMVRFAFRKTIVTNIGNAIILGGAISSAVTYIYFITSWQSIFAIIPCGVVIFFLILQYIRFKIKEPLKSIVAISNAISEGRLIDSDFNMDVSLAENELGDLSRSIHATYRDLSQIVSYMVHNISTLQHTVELLVDKSNQLQTNADDMKTQSSGVSAASEEMNLSMSSVSSSARQSAGSLDRVATAIENMSATISEIAGNTEQSRSISGEAVAQASHMSENIRQLEASAREADTIIDTINEIVDQTKLLSLNATIEAARAGDVGKGFAVVAGEVKQLAEQTEEAVVDIRRKLAAMAKFRSETVADINRISEIINRVDEYVSTVAAAFEEQNITTRDIAGNVEETNRGVAEVDRQVEESARVSRKVADDLAHLDQAVENVGAAGGSVRDSAEKLAGMTEKMQKLVAKFEVREDRADLSN